MGMCVSYRYQITDMRLNAVNYSAGIHNESGIEKRKLPPARELISDMLSYITNMMDESRAFLPFKHDGKDRVVLMVNNLGGISELEMGLIVQEALSLLDEKGIEVVRANVGSFMVRPCDLSPCSLPSLTSSSCLDIVQPSRVQLDAPSSTASRRSTEIHSRTDP